MWMQWLPVVFVGVIALTTVQGQSTAQSSSTNNKDSGLIYTVREYFADSSTQIRHLQEFPGYSDADSAPTTRISLPDTNLHFLSVDVDFRRSNVYMYDNYYGAIFVGNNYTASINATELEYKRLHAVMSYGTVQVAYDWLSHTVYWTDPSFKMIVAASGEWEKVKDEHFKIIVSDHLEYPDGITVDPIEGYMFWTDNGVHPKIERARLDGSERHTLVSRNLKSPMTMEADIFWKRIFWIDTWTASILSADYDGKDLRVINRLERTLIFDLAVYKNVLYASDISNRAMHTMDKKSGEKRADVIHNEDAFEYIYGIAVYSNETQKLKDRDYCAEKKCEHMCISEMYGARCLCGEGYRLNTTTQKCDEYAGAFHKAFVFANASHICLEDFRSLMGVFSFETVCRFTMIKQNPKAPSNDIPLKRKKRQATSQPTTPANQTIPASTTTTTTTKAATTPHPPPTTTKTTTTTTTTTTTATTTTTTIPPPPTVAPEDSIRMIELDMKDRFVFFVTQNNRIYRRSLDLPIENEEKEQMTIGTSEINDIAYDPEDRNLYWSQSDGHIYVINVDSRVVDRLTTDSLLNNPHNLVVLIHQRQLAFIDGDPDNMTIYTMDFDGTNINSPLENFGIISSLIYDKDTSLFYFLVPGEGKLYSVRLDGEEEPSLLTSYLNPNTYILMEYHRYFILVYSSTLHDKPNLLRTVYKTAPNTEVGSFYFDNVSTIVDIKILDADRQATPPGLCSTDNGGCAQLCISKLVNGKARKVCDCKKGFTLTDDKLNCTSNPVSDNFLLFPDWTNDEVLQYAIDTGELHAIPAQDNYLYMSVFLDPDTLRVYWSSYYDSYVYSSKLDGSDLLKVAHLGYSFPFKFEKDSSTGNVYYTSYFFTQIGLITPSGVNVELIGGFGSEQLEAITLHPGTGHLYYAVSTNEGAYIARADMDGQNVEKIMEDGPIIRPEGMVIDYVHDHLYICDNDEDTIIQCDLDGNYCITIVNTTGQGITDMDTDGTYLYYSTYTRDYIVRVDLFPPYNDMIFAKIDGLGIVNTISYYSSKNKNKQPVDNACQENNGLGDCSKICIPTPDGRSCACEENVNLHPDGRTCEDEHLCKDIIIHKNPNTNETIEIRFHSSCFRRENSTCKYKCPANYVPIDDTNAMLTCQIDGWDRETHALCRELQCASTFENGAVLEDCSKNIGSICNFTCDEGFTKSKTELYCRDDELWHGQDEGICLPKKCNASILHGKLDPSCDRLVGSKCSFTCDRFYDYVAPQKVSEITCGDNDWNMDTGALCEDAKCDDSSLMNGMVDAGCVNHVGRSCPYTCNDFYINTTEKAVCGFNQKWHPEQACTMLYCPMTVEHGFVDVKCSPKVNSVCRYHCDDLFSPMIKLGNITCLPSGQWNVSRDLCQVTPVTSPRGMSKSVSTGLIAALVVVGAILLALIVAILLMYKRSRGSAFFATASFKNVSDNVAIENPGYGRSILTNIELNDDRPYSGDQNQSTEQTTDRGRANPLYDNANLG